MSADGRGGVGMRCLVLTPYYEHSPRAGGFGRVQPFKGFHLFWNRLRGTRGKWANEWETNKRMLKVRLR